MRRDVSAEVVRLRGSDSPEPAHRFTFEDRLPTHAVAPLARTWRVRCWCGWWGRWQPSKWRAEQDAARHHEDAEAAPRPAPARGRGGGGGGWGGGGGGGAGEGGRRERARPRHNEDAEAAE